MNKPEMTEEELITIVNKQKNGMEAEDKPNGGV